MPCTRAGLSELIAPVTVLRTAPTTWLWVVNSRVYRFESPASV